MRGANDNFVSPNFLSQTVNLVRAKCAICVDNVKFGSRMRATFFEVSVLKTIPASVIFGAIRSA